VIASLSLPTISLSHAQTDSLSAVSQEIIMSKFLKPASLAIAIFVAASFPALAETIMAKPNFTVMDYKEAPLEQVEKGMNTYSVTIKERVSGDIEGEAVAHYLQNRIDGDSAAAASFTGFERVTGSLGGKKGSFLLQSSGTIKDGIVSGTWFVVPASGTDELAKLSGEGTFKAKLGQAGESTLNYTLE
jgi:hypothetical protein